MLWSKCCSWFGLCDPRALLQAGILSYFGVSSVPALEPDSDFLRAPAAQEHTAGVYVVRFGPTAARVLALARKNSVPHLSAGLSPWWIDRFRRLLPGQPSSGRRG